jgi:hypothetical protein
MTLAYRGYCAIEKTYPLFSIHLRVAYWCTKFAAGVTHRGKSNTATVLGKLNVLGACGVSGELCRRMEYGTVTILVGVLGSAMTQAVPRPRSCRDPGRAMTQAVP